MTDNIRSAVTHYLSYPYIYNYHLHFTDEESEVQVGYITWPSPPS